MKKTEEEISKKATELFPEVDRLPRGLGYHENDLAHHSQMAFIEGAKWMQEQDNTELREKDLALGNAYRMLKQIDNIVGLSEPQKKRLEIISVTIKKYFNVSDCLRVTQSDDPPKH